MNTPELPKAYNPKDYEAQIYKLWETSNAFKPNPDSPKDPYCIIMPPPNANGHIHIGTAMFTIEDLLVRYKRMQGHKALWLPGTDHAGIETQVVYERELAKKGKSRFDFTREQFYSDVMKWTKSNQKTILNELKSMGFGADWSRLQFTLDDKIVEVVYDTFKKLRDDGYIYRGNRIVNWCPHCHSAFADIEVKHREQLDPLYYVKYGPFVVATVRPEPMFADTGIAVNPDDERYQEWIGKEVEVELLWGKKKLRVIADKYVDPNFGTGVVKLTPAHDHNDWEMAQNHGLDVVQGIGTDGKITEAGGRFAGMPAQEARDEVVKELEAKGLMDHIDMNYSHSIAYHDRCGTAIEPLVVEQWWLKVDELKKTAIEAIKSGKIEFVPKRFAKIALNWLENLHDWNISRQNWWGIRVPVYYNATDDKTKPEYIVATDESEAEKIYGKGGYEAETDNFDTWFSSGQWPYATLMASGDYNDGFYPTSVMETGRDILFLWVTRMIMFGVYRTGQVPFKTVYLHGLINDEHGKKMSKSKGNVINPLEMTDEYGTDALRLALTIGITPGNDGSLAKAKVAGYRNFCNKLWNVARYTLSQQIDNYDENNISLSSPADHWVLERINQSIEEVTQYIEDYKFSEAGQRVYSLLWDDIADKYLEYSKTNLNPSVLAYSLTVVLKLLHPIAPFVTETIWQELPWTQTLLINEQWPKTIVEPDSKEAKKFEIEIIEVLATKQKNENKVKSAKLLKQIKAKRNLLTLIEAKLQNDKFAQNAPPEVVEREREKQKQTLSEIKDLEAELEKISS